MAASNEDLFVFKCGLLNDSNEVERYDFITWSSKSGTLLSTEIINYYGVLPEHSVWHAFRSFEILVKGKTFVFGHNEKDEMVVIDQEKNMLPALKLLKKKEVRPITIWVRCPFLKQKPKRLSNPPKLSESPSGSKNCISQQNWNMSCSNCKSNINGFIYQCLECVLFNMCSNCERAGTHPEHAFIRLAGSMPKNMDSIRQIINEAIQQENSDSPTVLRHECHEILQKLEEGINRMNTVITQLHSMSDKSVLESSFEKVTSTFREQLDNAMALITSRAAQLKTPIVSWDPSESLTVSSEDSVKTKDNTVEVKHELPFHEVQNILEAELEPKDSSCPSTIFQQQSEDTAARDEDAYWTLVENELAEAEASELSLKKLPVAA